jgi:hypothetical protein
VINLPSRPSPANEAPIFIDQGSILRGGLGSPDQRVNRLGDRFGLAVTMAPMPDPKTGRIWVSRLIQAKSQGARMRWPLNNFDPGAPGDIRINGGAQTGSTLAIDGATPNYVFREGQFFSIITNGSRFLYMVSAETIANNSGQANLPIWPMIRGAHLDNDVCEFGKPMIEGFVQGDTWQWEWALANFTHLQFEIHERA